MRRGAAPRSSPRHRRFRHGGLLGTSYRRIRSSTEAVDSNFSFMAPFHLPDAGGLLDARGGGAAKNTRNILLKNLLDTCIGACVWSGNTLAHGRGALSHASGPRPQGARRTRRSSSRGRTGCSPCTRRRRPPSSPCRRRAHDAVRVRGVLVRLQLDLPFIVHWAWSTHGWLSPKNGAFLGGMIDFAGGGVVHLTGGTVALVRPPARPPARGRPPAPARAPARAPLVVRPPPATTPGGRGGDRRGAGASTS